MILATIFFSPLLVWAFTWCPSTTQRHNLSVHTWYVSSGILSSPKCINVLQYMIKHVSLVFGTLSRRSALPDTLYYLKYSFPSNLIVYKARKEFSCLHPVGKIGEKAVCSSVYFWQHLNNELTKMHFLRLFFWRFCPLGLILDVNPKVAGSNPARYSVILFRVANTSNKNCDKH